MYVLHAASQNTYFSSTSASCILLRSPRDPVQGVHVELAGDEACVGAVEGGIEGEEGFGGYLGVNWASGVGRT